MSCRRSPRRWGFSEKPTLRRSATRQMRPVLGLPAVENDTPEARWERPRAVQHASRIAILDLTACRGEARRVSIPPSGSQRGKRRRFRGRSLSLELSVPRKFFASPSHNQAVDSELAKIVLMLPLVAKEPRCPEGLCAKDVMCHLHREYASNGDKLQTPPDSGLRCRSGSSYPFDSQGKVPQLSRVRGNLDR